MMIKELEDALFSEWKLLWKKDIASDVNSCFVTDGVVNEEIWNLSKIKVLYFLKEVNGADEEWDERDYLLRYNTDEVYRKNHSQTIATIIKWQYGINYGKTVTWQELEETTQDEELQTKLLSQIALVNIKKTAGKGTVNWNDFDAYIKIPDNKEKLIQQMEIYNPDLVICGSTAWYFKQMYGWKEKDWKITSRGVRYRQEGKTTYIDFYHPNNRGPKSLVYYGLLDTLEELHMI